MQVDSLDPFVAGALMRLTKCELVEQVLWLRAKALELDRRREQSDRERGAMYVQRQIK